MPLTARKFKNVMKHVTLEPVVFFYMTAAMMTSLANQNLALEKACRVNLAFNASICDAMVARNRSGYNMHEEVQVQRLVSKFAGYRAILMGTVPVIWMAFLGSWSDRHSRRKPLILLPLIGDMLGIMGQFVCSHFLLELPLEVSFVVDIVPPLIFGGMGIFYLGIFSYVSGLCTDEDRTLKIGTVSMCYPIGMSVGLFFSGITLNHFGYKGVYTFSSSCMLFAFTYGLFMIREKKEEISKEEKKGFFRDLFALEYVINTFNTCFKQGKEQRRKKIIVVMVLIMLMTGPTQGEFTVLYLYLRFKCGWNEVDYSLYNSVHFGIQLFGNSFSLTFFSKYLKLDDALLGVIAMTSKIMACLIYAFAPSGLYFYVGAVVEIFYATCYISLRAIMAKIVPPHELGQSNSVFGICEALTPFIFGPVYSWIYAKTLTFFPGTFYLLTSIIYAISFYLFTWLYMQNKTELKCPVKQEEPIEFDKTSIS